MRQSWSTRLPLALAGLACLASTTLMAQMTASVKVNRPCTVKIALVAKAPGTVTIQDFNTGKKFGTTLDKIGDSIKVPDKTFLMYIDKKNMSDGMYEVNLEISDTEPPAGKAPTTAVLKLKPVTNTEFEIKDSSWRSAARFVTTLLDKAPFNKSKTKPNYTIQVTFPD